MTTRVIFVDETYTTPNNAGPSSLKFYEVFIESPIGIEAIIYDDRVPAGVLAHDHGQGRGAPLEEAFYSRMLGPHDPEGGAAGTWEEGIPVYPKTSVTESFQTRPKLLIYDHMWIPGGVKEFTLEAIFYMDDTGAPLAREVTLLARLRPLYELGLDYDHGVGPSVSITHSISGSVEETRDAWEFSSLAALGGYGMDRECLLEIWLTEDPPAGSTFRLCALAAFAGELPTENDLAEPDEWVGSKAAPSPFESAEGQIVYSRIGYTAHLRFNQLILEALGGAGALGGSLSIPDTAQAYRQIVTRPHTHEGRIYTDPDTDELVLGGALIRGDLFGQCYISELGSTASQMDGEPSQGMLIHQNGDLDEDNGWFTAEGRGETPIGCRALEVVFAVAPNHVLEEARLWFYLRLEDLHSEQIEIAVSTAGGVTDPEESGGFTRILVDPLDGPLWTPNAKRAGAGLALWTTQAKRSPYPSRLFPNPDTIPRVSQKITATFTPSRTMGIRYRARWALETGALGSATYEEAARVAFVSFLVPYRY